jgi:Ca2+-binding EF-hand superfamily protein
MEEHIRKIFGLFNINKNGYLSKEEITGKIDFCFLF